MQEILSDSITDSLKLLPFLLFSYLLVEYAEHKMSGRTKELIYRAGKAGPVLGSLVGLIPQCGFSAAAAGLFAGGMLSPGTLIAVFLATSDEMLPVMISEGEAAGVIIRILAVKAVAGMVIGLIVDFAAEAVLGPRNQMPEHPDMCGDGHCGCGEHGIIYSALNHTVRTWVFLFVISFAIALAMSGFDASDGFVRIPVLEEALAALIGMIPNCAASVLVTELYLEGILKSGALFAGLLCGAGTGLLVLFRENKNLKENVTLTAVLYAGGTAVGILAGSLGIL